LTQTSRLLRRSWKLFHPISDASSGLLVVMLNCAMHNVLRPSLLGDFRTSNGELIWEKRENPVAEAKAARESPSPYSALSVDVWFRLIRPRDTQSGSPLSILSLHVNSDSKEASFRLAKSHSITVSAVRCILERSRLDKHLSGKQNLADAATRPNTTCQILLSFEYQRTHHISWFSK
jgi:hypothetical protein